MPYQVPAIEIRRKILHILLGLAVIFGIYFDLLTVFHLFLVLCLGIIFSFILAKYKKSVLYKLLDLFERKHTHPGKGAITFMIGCILALKLFPEDVALTSIMILAVGDGLATIVGIAFGKTKTFLSEVKLLEGTIVGMILGGLAGALFIPLWQSMLAAVIAMGIEATELKMNNKILSDNILVPLASGVVILLLRMYF